MKLYLETDKGQRIEIKQIDNIAVSTKVPAAKRCEYCCTNHDNTTLFVEDFKGQEWDIELILDDFLNENLLTVELNTRWKEEYVDFPIKYCPFCGREL